MIITLTGVFFYHESDSLDNFQVKIHKNKEEAVNFIYGEAEKYLKKCTCVCGGGKNKCINCPEKQLNELRDIMRCLYKFEDYEDYEDGFYSDDYSEFHYKIINS